MIKSPTLAKFAAAFRQYDAHTQACGREYDFWPKSGEAERATLTWWCSRCPRTLTLAVTRDEVLQLRDVVPDDDDLRIWTDELRRLIVD